MSAPYLLSLIGTREKWWKNTDLKSLGAEAKDVVNDQDGRGGR